MKDETLIRPLVSRRLAVLILAVLAIVGWAALWWVEHGGPLVVLLLVVYLMGYLFAQLGPRIPSGR